MVGFLQRLFQLFRSLRIVNLLLLLIALIAALGTFPSFPKSFPFKPEAIYRSKWFLFLLGYLACAAAYYVFEKTIGILRFSKAQETGLHSQPPMFRHSVHLSIAFPLLVKHSAAILKALTRKGYHSTEERKEGGYSITASKNRHGVWGASGLHAGLVLVLVGGLSTFLFANVRDVMLPEGETMVLPGLSEKVRLEKFSVLLHPGRSDPDEYISRLLIVKGNRGLTRHELKVNHPIQIGWTKLFQMRYRVEILRLDLVVYHHGKAIERLALNMGEPQALSHYPYLVRAEDVVPDFVMGQDGTVTSRSPYFQNPAARVVLYSAENPQEMKVKTWAFQDFVSHTENQAEAEWSFIIDKIRKRYVSGIKLSFDPGVPFVYTGFIFLVLGAFVSSFMIPRELRIFALPAAQGEGTQLEIQGLKAKDGFGLRRELENLGKTLSDIPTGNKS